MDLAQLIFTSILFFVAGYSIGYGEGREKRR